MSNDTPGTDAAVWEKRYADMLTQRDNALHAAAAARAELAEANGLVEQFRRDLGVWEKRYADMLTQRDNALHAAAAARAELAEAKTLLHTIWHGTVNAPARERWLRLIADVVPAAAPQADYVYPHHCSDHDGTPCPPRADDVAAVPGDGEQAPRMYGDRVVCGNEWRYPLNDDRVCIRDPQHPLPHHDCEDVAWDDDGEPVHEGDGEQAATTSHGWTSHGYACCGEAKVGERPNNRARCMGNPRCSKCRDEAEQIHTALPTSGQA